MELLMTVEGVFRIPGRGLAVSGLLTGEDIRIGQTVTLRFNEIERTTVVTGLSSGFDRVEPEVVTRGVTVGLLLRGDDLDVIQDGQPWNVFRT